MADRWELPTTRSAASTSRSGPSSSTTPAAPAAPASDPYVRWATLTQWRGYARIARWGDSEPGARPLKSDEVAIIAFARDPQFLDSLRRDGTLAQAPWLHVSPEYGRCLPGTRYRPPFFTARLSRADFMQHLLGSTLPLDWRLAMPRRTPQNPLAASSKGLFGPDRDASVLPARNLLEDDFEQAPPGPARESLGGALAVIDFGCPFANTTFARFKAVKGDGRPQVAGTRVAALWDQGDSARPRAGWPWQQPLSFDHGRVLGPDALDRATLRAHGAEALDECAMYRGLDYLVDHADARRRVWYGTHGGHVLHMAGGHPDPLAPNGAPQDAASRAPLVFVQLPLPTALDSAGASLSAHLLDGVRFALSLARAGSPLVINVSYGGQAGPHDGQTLVERAFDDLVENARGNTAIVLAAGNSRQARAHARRTVREGRSALLRVAVSEQDTTDTFVEIWYDHAAGQDLVLRARSPETLWSEWVAAGQECVMHSQLAPMEPVALLKHESRVSNGSRAMALLAIAPTAQPPGLPCGLACAGLWQVEVSLRGSGEADVHAWIERDDPDHDTAAARPYFVDQADGDDLDTLSSIANGRCTVRVGGFNRGTGDTTHYSSTGPRAAPGAQSLPQVLAACEDDADNPTVAGAATRSLETLRINGTSVAAPALSRRLYNALCAHAAAKGSPLKAAGVLELARQLAEQDSEGVLKPGPG